MRKNKNEIWTNLYIWLIVCALIGIIICFGILFLFSVFLYSTTEVIKSFTIFSAVSLLSGSFSGGYFCGLFRRKNGLYEGFFCGFAIYIILLTASLIFFHSPLHILSIRKFLICTISASAGGITGVNHKRPKNIRS